MKNMKNGQKMFLIAQKGRPDALNAMNKFPVFYKVRCLKKSRKTSQNDHFFLLFLVKNGYFMRIFLSKKKNIFCTERVFFALHSVRQDASFGPSKTSFGHFFIFFIMRGDPSDFKGGKNLPAPDVEEAERGKNDSFRNGIA
jgi:hypothetical protein